MNAIEEFMNSLKATLAETGRSLNTDLDVVRASAAEQLVNLSLAAGEPGYDMAVIAARDIVAMTAGLQAVSVADATDARIIGVIQGSLSMAAKLAVA